MKKAFKVFLVILLLISIGFNIYLYKQIKGIKAEEETLSKEIAVLETTISEKDTVLVEKDTKIVELEQTILDLTAEVETLKEQISSIESEKAEINEELETAKKEIEEAKQKGLEPEQSSTVGGTGHTEEPAANPEYVPSDEPNQMDPTEAAAKFGMTFGGSGMGGSTGADLGNGGYGITLQ